MEPNPNEWKPTNQVFKKRKPLWPIILGFVLLAAVLAGGRLLISLDSKNQNLSQSADSFKFFKPTTPQPDSPQQASDKEEDLPVESLSSAEEDASPHNEIGAPENVTAIDKLENLDPQQQCALLSGELQQFFSHIDNKQYIKTFNLNQPSLDYFNQLIIKLFANPPVVSRESDDLYSMLTNMAHFFRVIGRQNILLIKGILDRESSQVEDVAAQLYQWNIINHCAGGTFKMEVPIDKVYEYAGFFLNTMGGRSYLFRRNSRSRLLVHYYSILIIDRANKENLNRHGLDIQELIPKLILEIEATNQLIYKEDYVDTLHGLMERYQQ